MSVEVEESSREYCDRTGEDWSHVEWDRPPVPDIGGSSHTHRLDEPDLREHLRTNSVRIPWVTHYCTVIHVHRSDVE